MKLLPHEKRGSVRVAWISYPDMSQFDHMLPVATPFNNGGFRLPTEEPAYSPIDLSIALIQTDRANIRLTNLKQFFLSNPWELRFAEHDVYACIILDGFVHPKCIAEWKEYMRKDKRVITILQAIAPFTFK